MSSRTLAQKNRPVNCIKINGCNLNLIIYINEPPGNVLSKFALLLKWTDQKQKTQKVFR